ncbi:hypothetical protein DXV76_02165 [Rhodobacteraceae bacterium CCMM004]|nr:hypothetical protein DXV76_02165 [Rhodobacteraceae bacterium CCMM004]
MQIVPSTFIALLAIVVLAMRGPQRALWAYFALIPFGAAAAFNLPALGGATIGLKELASVAILALIFLTPGGPNRLAGALRPGQPGFWLLLLMLYAIFSALFLPVVFRGETEVFAISRSANEKGIIAIPLRPTTGNITQLFYMTLAALAFMSLSTLFRANPDTRIALVAVATATSVNFALGWIDVLSAAVGLDMLLDPIRTANYAILAEHRMAGLKRMIGGFPEASAFGAFSLGMFAFWLQYWVTGPRSRLAGIMLLMSAIVLLRSTSSGAYVATVVFLVGFAMTTGLSRTRARVPRRLAMAMFGLVLALWGASLVLFAAYELVDPVTAFFDRAVFDKLETDSGVERMSWNAQAFRNFVDTKLLGAGIGSVRASNWLLAALGSLGLIGTALYLTFLAALGRMPVGPADPATAATVGAFKAACAALFLNALLTGATPNLGVTFFSLAGVCVGLARGAQIAARTPRRTAHRPATGTPHAL